MKGNSSPHEFILTQDTFAVVEFKYIYLRTVLKYTSEAHFITAFSFHTIFHTATLIWLQSNLTNGNILQLRKPILSFQDMMQF